LYRFAYYLFPVLIALILSTFEFRNTAKRYLDDSKIMIPVKDMSSLLASYQKDILTRIPAFSIALLLLFTSALFFFNEQQDAFVMYRYKGNAYIVLGDPIGNSASFH